MADSSKMAHNPNSTTLRAAITGALVGGVTAAIVSGSLKKVPESPPPTLESSLLKDNGHLDFQSSIDSLQIANEQLRERLAALEMQSGSRSRVPSNGFASMDDIESLEKKLTNSLNSIDSGDAAITKERLAETLATIRHEEAVAKEKEKQAKWSAALETRVEKYSEWLQLDTYQEEELRQALVSKDERNSEMLQLWESGAPHEEVGAVKRENETFFQENLQRFLTPNQLQTFQQRLRGK